MGARDHAGQFPPRLDVLISHADVQAEAFVCPASADTKATGPTSQAVRADFAKPGRCSYRYFGAGLGVYSPGIEKRVLACEALTNHSGEGISILWGDGRAEWLPSPQAGRLLKELDSGHNPPRAEMWK